MRSVIIGAFSSHNAKKGALEHSKIVFQDKKKFDQIKAVPLIPISKNMYWDTYNRSANPDTLMLNDYLNKTGEQK